MARVKTWARRFVAKTLFPRVASRANMLYLAASTHTRSAVCLYAAHIAALREFWTNWLPTSPGEDVEGGNASTSMPWYEAKNESTASGAAWRSAQVTLIVCSAPISVL